MQGYLLDTNICVFYLRGKYALNKKMDNIKHFKRINHLVIENWIDEK